MKKIIAIEELFLFLLTLYLFYLLSYPWWLYPMLFLLPDLSMAGYMINAKVGAMLYNLVHHRAVGISFFVAGSFLGLTLLQLIGLVLFGHSSFDRMMGYGLKYSDAFQNTHLGWIGRNDRS